MALRPYSRYPWRALAQVCADVAVLVWVVVWVRVGQWLHDALARLAVPGVRVSDAADGLAGHLRESGRTIADLPFVGPQVARPLDAAAGSAGDIGTAFRQLSDTMLSVAGLVGVLTAGLPIAVLLGVWLPARLRFARRAGAAVRLAASGADLDLFALRALANQPVHRLLRVSQDPAAGWRARDPGVVRALAELELRSLGVRPPA